MLNWFGDVRKDGRVHMGTDIHTRPQLEFSVRAGISGQATYYGEGEPSGGRVTITDIPGFRGVTVQYLHVTAPWEEGQTVEVNSNTVIGEARMQGNSTSHHLHMEVLVNGVHQNPMEYIQHSPSTLFGFSDPLTGIEYYIYVPRSVEKGGSRWF
jgi:murein DD-endopeptidase MepM/ murein hydrolase activator NlpD